MIMIYLYSEITAEGANNSDDGGDDAKMLEEEK
ncbi:MAG: hypothetical protein JWQ63_919 [Mucilaginibacter sp.]|jgi:hypothetical protein|nr:hypothetical protein [Mucilaginibacter sp.]